MDQPGNSHYSLNMSQQTLNGHGGYYGRGYEANGHEGNGGEANGYAYNGYAEGMPPDYHAAATAPGTMADAGIDTAPRPARTGSTTTPPGRTRAWVLSAKALSAKTLPAKALPTRMPASAIDPAPDGLDGQDATGTADGEAAASGDTLNGTRAADRMRELLARSTVDHAATERATAITLDGIVNAWPAWTRGHGNRRARGGVERGRREPGRRATRPRRSAWHVRHPGRTDRSLSMFRARSPGSTASSAEADSRLAGADVKLASTEGRVTALDTRFERLDERLDDQYDRVSSIDERVSSIDGRVAVADGRISPKAASSRTRSRPWRTSCAPGRTGPRSKR